MAIITLAQCRAARGLLGWNQEELAKAAKVALNTLRNFEGGKSVPMANNLAAIQAALEAAGVIFVPENGQGAGVRLRKVEWRRTQDGDEPTRDQLVSINYTIDGRQVHFATWDPKVRRWRIANTGDEVTEADVPQWHESYPPPGIVRR